MRNTRKLLLGAVAAASLAGATALTYADPHAGFGPGAGPCAFGGGPGAMGYGPHGGGPMGPGMMGYGRGGGGGPGMMGPQGRGYGPGAAGAGPVSHMEGRLAFLKAELKITADQEAAWNAYANQSKAHAAAMEALRAQAPAAPQSATERMDRRAEFAAQRAEQLKSMSAAVKDLYAVLTPEQKTIAEQHFGGMRVSQLGPRGYGRGR